MRLDDAKSVTFVQKNNDEFGAGYCGALSKSLPTQDVKITGTISLSDIKNSAADNSRDVAALISKSSHAIIPLYTDDIYRIAEALKAYPDNNTTLIFGDTAADLGDIFDARRKCVVVVPAIVDYTETTRELVIGAEKETGVTGHIAYETPFNYDCAYQIGYMIRNELPIDWEHFAIAGDSSKPRAAVVSSWYDKQRRGLPIGGYWFIYTHDPVMGPNIKQFREESLGGAPTLPQSGAAAFHIGKFVWAGGLGWNVYQNTWERFTRAGALILPRLNYHIKLSLIPISHLTGRPIT